MFTTASPSWYAAQPSIREAPRDHSSDRRIRSLSRSCRQGHNFSHTPIRTLLKASPTGLVLLAVNLDAAGPLLVRFSFAHGVLGANVSALFEGEHGRLLTTLLAGLRFHTDGAVLQGSRR